MVPAWAEAEARGQGQPPPLNSLPGTATMSTTSQLQLFWLVERKCLVFVTPYLITGANNKTIVTNESAF